MRFTDFLKATAFVLGSEATALGAVSILTAALQQDTRALPVALGVMFVAAIAGAISGRKDAITTGFSRLLADARAQNALPPLRPGAILINRLWPLAIMALGFAAAAIWYPQAPGIAAAFLIFVALRWRKQEQALEAIEQRDGARFYVVLTSPLRSIQLVRTPGMRRVDASLGD